jgi:hypothetical protein
MNGLSYVICGSINKLAFILTLNLNVIISLSVKSSIKTKKTLTSKAKNCIICHLNILICSVREKTVNFDVEIDLGMSNETHVTNRKLLTLTEK